MARVLNLQSGTLAAGFILAGVLAASAQDVTPDATMEMMMEATSETMMESTASLTVSDQAVLNGSVIIESVTTDVAGFVAIHADMNGQPGHVVGIASVLPGTAEGLAVAIDGGMSTPTLYAMLHTDDGEISVFEFGKVPGADLPVEGAGSPSFTIAGIFSYDQQNIGDIVNVAAAVSPVDGFLVIHADNGSGQPGPVLGQVPVIAGTSAALEIELSDAPMGIVFAMLHVDDGEIGTYEFDGQSGLDNPQVINGTLAFRGLTLGDAPVTVLADGSPITTDLTPAVAVSDQELGADNTFIVDSIVSPGPGVVDVHASMDGHPVYSLGHTILNDGVNEAVPVMLMPPPAMTTATITPVVFAMLHSDTDADGVYRYLQIPGVDLPVVYNGLVVTLPANITGEDVMEMDMMMMDMTAEATMDMGMAATGGAATGVAATGVASTAAPAGIEPTAAPAQPTAAPAQPTTVPVEPTAGATTDPGVLPTGDSGVPPIDPTVGVPGGAGS